MLVCSSSWGSSVHTEVGGLEQPRATPLPARIICSIILSCLTSSQTKHAQKGLKVGLLFPDKYIKVKLFLLFAGSGESLLMHNFLTILNEWYILQCTVSELQWIMQKLTHCSPQELSQFTWNVLTLKWQYLLLTAATKSLYVWNCFACLHYCKKVKGLLLTQIFLSPPFIIIFPLNYAVHTAHAFVQKCSCIICLYFLYLQCPVVVLQDIGFTIISFIAGLSQSA